MALPLRPLPNILIVNAMTTLPILPLLILIPLPLIIPTATKGSSLSQFYESLRELPCLPPSPTTLDRIRHEIHKIYFQYLVTGPGYVLEPVERIFFDTFILILIGAMIYCMVLVSPPVLRLIGGGVLSGKGSIIANAATEEALSKWSGNMSLSVRTVFGTATAAGRNATSKLEL